MYATALLPDTLCLLADKIIFNRNCDTKTFFLKCGLFLQLRTFIHYLIFSVLDEIIPAFAFKLDLIALRTSSLNYYFRQANYQNFLNVHYICVYQLSQW